MELQGTIKMLGETKTVSNNGFRKRELVVKTDEQFPQTILVEFVQDKCDVLNNYAEGQEVKIGINLRGREWVNPQGETKYFNSIQGWRIDSAETNTQNSQKATKAAQKMTEPAEEEDDLPF